MRYFHGNRVLWVMPQEVEQLHPHEVVQRGVPAIWNADVHVAAQSSYVRGNCCCGCERKWMNRYPFVVERDL